MWPNCVTADPIPVVRFLYVTDTIASEAKLDGNMQMCDSMGD